MEMYEKRKEDDKGLKVGDKVVCSQNRGNNILLTIEGVIDKIEGVFLTIKDKYGDLYDFDEGETTRL